MVSCLRCTASIMTLLSNISNRLMKPEYLTRKNCFQSKTKWIIYTQYIWSLVSSVVWLMEFSSKLLSRWKSSSRMSAMCWSKRMKAKLKISAVVVSTYLESIFRKYRDTSSKSMTLFLTSSKIMSLTFLNKGLSVKWTLSLTDRMCSSNTCRYSIAIIG